MEAMNCSYGIVPLTDLKTVKAPSKNAAISKQNIAFSI